MIARAAYCSVIKHLPVAIVCMFAGAAIGASAQGDTSGDAERGRHPTATAANSDRQMD